MQNNVAQIYWEKQADDQLCGVHCINSLLQGPFFDEIQLASIAIDLDKQEQALLGDNQDYSNKSSNNVANDGNFSIQVLSEALSRLGKLTVESVDKQINKNQDLTNEEGFICNSSDHWFTIRKINGVFYNLNSLSKIGPEIITDFYLSAFLVGVKQDGFTIFVVKGEYPYCGKDIFGQFQKHQLYFTHEQIQQNMKNNKGKKQNFYGSDQENIDKAIEESLKDYKQRTEDFKPPEPDSQNEENKFKAFSGQGHTLSEAKGQTIDYPNMFIDPQTDPEYHMILLLSLQEKFQKKPEQGITISFRKYDGSQFQWTFSNDSRVEDLYDYVLASFKDQKVIPFSLQLSYPKKTLSSIDKTLFEEDITDMTVIFIQKL